MRVSGTTATRITRSLTRCVLPPQPWAPSAPAPPSGAFHALASALQGLVFAALHSLLTPRFPDGAFLNARWVAAHSVPYKLCYMWAMGLAARCKYYFVWRWAEAAGAAGGLGWSGYEPAKDGSSKPVARWERCANVHLRGVELAATAAELPQAWNTRTGAWLRHYAYERLLARGMPAFAALIATQAIAGVWHGTYAGYALFFTSSSLMLQAAKVLFRYQRALPRWAARPCAVAHAALTVFHLNYLAAAFIAVTLPGGRAAWASVGYAGHISMIVRPQRACGRCARALTQ
jgi:lysophospholipid acyltransferase